MQVDGTFARIDAALVKTTSWLDISPPEGEACYRVTAVDATDQESGPSDPACAGAPAAKAVREFEPTAPEASDLHLTVGPNPFNPTTTIHFRLAAPDGCIAPCTTSRSARGDARRRSALGRRHSLTWNADHVASGTYFLVLESGGRAPATS